MNLPPALRELREAALMMARSQCTRDWARARRRIEAAVAVVDTGRTDSERERLLIDLARFVEDLADDDPLAAELLGRIRGLGVLG